MDEPPSVSAEEEPKPVYEEEEEEEENMVPTYEDEYVEPDVSNRLSASLPPLHHHHRHYLTTIE